MQMAGFTRLQSDFATEPGAAPLIQNPDILEAAAGTLAVEAYHAGLLRGELYRRGLIEQASAIAEAREALDGPEFLDEELSYISPTTGERQAIIAPADEDAIAFSRTPAQVLNIVYLGGAASGFGFFPDRVNGIIA